MNSRQHYSTIDLPIIRSGRRNFGKVMDPEIWSVFSTLSIVEMSLRALFNGPRQFDGRAAQQSSSLHIEQVSLG